MKQTSAVSNIVIAKDAAGIQSDPAMTSQPQPQVWNLNVIMDGTVAILHANLINVAMPPSL